MGDVFPRAVGAGEAVAIATGGWLPAGADAVVMVEHIASLDGGARVELSRAVVPGANVVERGEDLARGAAVLPAARRLRPQDLAMLATFGITTVDVHRRPRVAVMSTGNELCDPAETPAPGPGPRRQPDRARRTGDRRRLRRHVRRHRPRRRAGAAAGDRARARRARRGDPVGRVVDRDQGPVRRRARRSRTARHPVSRHRHPARASRRCSRARAASPSWACPASRRRR